jgi:hypothetical protein
MENFLLSPLYFVGRETQIHLGIATPQSGPCTKVSELKRSFCFFYCMIIFFTVEFIIYISLNKHVLMIFQNSWMNQRRRQRCFTVLTPCKRIFSLLLMPLPLMQATHEKSSLEFNKHTRGIGYTNGGLGK